MRALCPLLLIAAMSCASVLHDEQPTFLAEAGWLEQEVGARLMLSGTGGFVYAPLLQGRVMNATVDLTEPGVGFVNRAAIEAREEEAHFHNHGGVERFWVGPEGSAFSLYFDPGAEFVPANWRVPKDLDVGAFEELALGELERPMRMSNRLGGEFEMLVRRKIEVPEPTEVEAVVGAIPEGVQWTAFRTVNTVENAGAQAWTRESGLPCIWLAGMFLPGDQTWAILPFRADSPDPDQGPPVRSENYFGALDDARLRIADDFAVFKTDAKYQSKIGILRNRARDVMGAYDPEQRLLTIVQFGPIDRNAPYVDQRWLTEGDAFYGDVINSYSHGGPEPFFELESSSPGLELAPGESHTHRSMTMHFRFADEQQLAAAVRAAFDLEWVEVQTLMAD